MNFKELLENCLEAFLGGSFDNANSKNYCFVEIVCSQHETNKVLSLSLLTLLLPSVLNDRKSKIKGKCSSKTSVLFFDLFIDNQ